ncbi:MAG: ATP-binding cassette domain-containing protein [Bacillota bacterium]|jgi:ABC-2 type transport system ATP-binding protein|nr:MAG: ATP-binding cassette domain-containing protein [Bacillota bacterium]
MNAAEIRAALAEPIISVEDLVKVYRGGVRAVDGVSFEVKRGEIFGFLGPNGAGKTTTIMMLITLLRPTAGRGRVCGRDITVEPDEVRARIGYVSQDIAVDDTLTGRENLFLQGHLYHLTKDLIAERCREVLEMVDLTDRAGSRVSTYSGGMRKRLDIAGGLIHRPELLFLDEPTLGLDIQTRRRIWDYIRLLRDRENVTIFMTTHYMEEADQLCDRVAIIDHGKVAAIGSPSELKAGIGGDLLFVEVEERPVGPAPSPDVSTEGAEFSSFLAGIEGVSRVTVQDGRWVLVVSSGELAAPRVLSAVAGRGHTVRSLAMKKPTLDDVFLHYTGRALREDEGSSDFLRRRIGLRRARA